MDDFATKPGETNCYGLIQGEVNAVAPGKRMLSSMCPSIAVVTAAECRSSGGPRAARRSPRRIFRSCSAFFLRGETPRGRRRARPRFHQQDLPDTIQIERDRFDAAWVAALAGSGTRRAEREPDGDPIGRVHAHRPAPGGGLERRSPTRGAEAPPSSCRAREAAVEG